MRRSVNFAVISKFCIFFCPSCPQGRSLCSDVCSAIIIKNMEKRFVEIKHTIGTAANIFK